MDTNTCSGHSFVVLYLFFKKRSLMSLATWQVIPNISRSSLSSVLFRSIFKCILGGKSVLSRLLYTLKLQGKKLLHTQIFLSFADRNIWTSSATHVGEAQVSQVVDLKEPVYASKSINDKLYT